MHACSCVIHVCWIITFMRARHFQVLLLQPVTELTYSCENHVQEMQVWENAALQYKKRIQLFLGVCAHFWNYIATKIISIISFSTVWINIGAVNFCVCM